MKRDYWMKAFWLTRVVLTQTNYSYLLRRLLFVASDTFIQQHRCQKIEVCIAPEYEDIFTDRIWGSYHIYPIQSSPCSVSLSSLGLITNRMCVFGLQCNNTDISRGLSRSKQLYLFLYVFDKSKTVLKTNADNHCTRRVPRRMSCRSWR